jgi:hypothetical protein
MPLKAVKDLGCYPILTASPSQRPCVCCSPSQEPWAAAAPQRPEYKDLFITPTRSRLALLSTFYHQQFIYTPLFAPLASYSGEGADCLVSLFSHSDWNDLSLRLGMFLCYFASFSPVRSNLLTPLVIKQEPWNILDVRQVCLNDSRQRLNQRLLHWLLMAPHLLLHWSLLLRGSSTGCWGCWSAPPSAGCFC